VNGKSFAFLLRHHRSDTDLAEMKETMNLPKSETFNTGATRLMESVQGSTSSFRRWLRSEFEDAQFYYIRFRAENGEAVNQYRFGLMYETGHRGLRSDYEAYKWFLRAAYQGHL